MVRRSHGYERRVNARSVNRLPNDLASSTRSLVKSFDDVVAHYHVEIRARTYRRHFEYTDGADCSGNGQTRRGTS